MDNLLKFLDEYKVFNYLVPGVLLVYLIGDGTWFNHVQHLNFFVQFFIYYLAGSISSRFGSVIVEELLKVVGFIKYKEYIDYMKASEKDSKTAQLSQENNVYRTYTAVFLFTFLFNGGDRLFGDSIITTRESTPFLLGVLFLALLMAFAYRKQTGYIAKRVDSVL